MMWLPVMVNSLLSGTDPMQLSTSNSTHSSTAHRATAADTGLAAVLLSTIPFTAAAIAVALSGVIAQKTGKPLILIMLPNFIGGVSFMCFHIVVHWSRIAGFMCLVITLSAAYASSPHAPTILARLVESQLAFIALPLYNSIAMLGGFAGPSIMGFLVQHLGGFGVATTVMGGSMIVAGCMAAVLCCIKLRERTLGDGRFDTTKQSKAVNHHQAPAVHGYELVYTRTNAP
eukprot:GHUV01028113.1.p1 GENE.GHUV01028113.1~~GHUV01028113.1.p1  ORF type:complete len:230 (+),score=57.98 GHUV01028113.1:415-1104(+)